MKSAEGFFCLSPGQPIGSKLEKASERLGFAPENLTPAAGYAVISGGKMHHMGKVPLAKARRLAMSLGDEAVIASAVGFADVDQLIWRKIEIIDRLPGGRFLRDDGELMQKISNGAQIEELTDAYAAKLKGEYSTWAKKQLGEYFDDLDVDWYGVGDVEKVFIKAGSNAITDAKDVKKLSATWAAASLLYLNRAAAQAREFTKTSFLPKIGSGISTGDKEAMKWLSRQPGFFLRDQLGRVNAGLTKHGVGIVRAGIGDGLGYREIGKELRDKIPGLWGKYGANYSNVVANVGVQRARAFAEITAYTEAGIDAAELIAVLDQRTTDICRFLDGQIISVNNVAHILNQTLEITNPEEIKSVSPWISTRKNPQTGIPQLVTRNGVVLADIVRSGYGRLDDRGQFSAYKMNDQLAIDANIGPPPYHGLCRTTMNPVVKTFSVPAQSWRQAIPTVALEPKPVSPINTPTILQGVTGAAYVNSIGASDRAYQTGEMPTAEKPAAIGTPLDPESGVWGEDGWLEAENARDQVKQRVSNALKKMSDAMSEIYRAKGRRNLSYKQKGALLNSIFQKRLKEVRSGSLSVVEKADVIFQEFERERGDVPRIEAKKIREYALSFLSDRMIKAIVRRKLPRLIYNRSPKGRPTGYWNQAERAFYIPKMENAKSRAVILRVFAEFFDTFGHCGEAAVRARNQMLASNTVFNVNGILYLDVATASFFDGLIYGERGANKIDATAGKVEGSSDTESNWTRSAFECLAEGMEHNLGFLWDTAPQQLAFLMAYIEGQFV